MLWTSLAFIATAAAQSEYPLAWGSASPLEQCRPATLRWSGGQGPYTLRVAEWDAAKGGATLGPLRRVLAQTYAVVYDWDVDYARGTRLYVEVIDDSGSVAAPTQALTVGDGPSSCSLWTPPTVYVGNQPGVTPLSSAKNALASASSAAGVVPAWASGVKGAPASAMASATSRSARPYDGGPMSMREPQTGDPIPRPAAEEHHGPNVGLIVGTTVAGVVVLAVILALAAWVHSLRKKNKALRARVAALEAEAPVLKYKEAVGEKSMSARSSSEHSSATCV